MKRVFSMLVLTAALSGPVLSFAQSNAPLTRQEVKNEMAQLSAAGYTTDPDASYPNQLLAAEQRVGAAQQVQAVTKNKVPGSSGYGPQAGGTSAAGTPAGVQPWAGEANGRIQP